MPFAVLICRSHTYFISVVRGIARPNCCGVLPSDPDSIDMRITADPVDCRCLVSAKRSASVCCRELQDVNRKRLVCDVFRP